MAAEMDSNECARSFYSKMECEEQWFKNSFIALAEEWFFLVAICVNMSVFCPINFSGCSLFAMIWFNTEISGKNVTP